MVFISEPSNQQVTRLHFVALKVLEVVERNERYILFSKGRRPDIPQANYSRSFVRIVTARQRATKRPVSDLGDESPERHEVMEGNSCTGHSVTSPNSVWISASRAFSSASISASGLGGSYT